MAPRTALFPIAFTQTLDEARTCKWDGDLPWELGGILLVSWRTVKGSGAEPAEGNSEPSQPGGGGGLNGERRINLGFCRGAALARDTAQASAHESFDVDVAHPEVRRKL